MPTKYIFVATQLKHKNMPWIHKLFTNHFHVYSLVVSYTCTPRIIDNITPRAYGYKCKSCKCGLQPSNQICNLFSLVKLWNSTLVTKWIKSCLLQCFGMFKMPILMFNSILAFRPDGQIWNPVRRDTRIYVRRILNASRISKTQLNSCTISPS